MTIAQDKRWRAELEIIEEEGKVLSSRKMQEFLAKRGIKVTHAIILKDLKKDLETLTEPEYKNQKTGIMKMLNDEIDMAHDIAMNNEEDETRLKASNTVTKLQKTKADILIKFRKAQVELNKEDKPMYNVSIGKPRKYVGKKNEKVTTKDI
jgi:acyl-CoA synthetase (NDP forming)